MARLQILELPEGSNDDRAPFVLVIDQADEATLASLREQASRGVADPATYNPVAEQIGARAILVFAETVDIPVNETPVDPDGYPLKIRIEPDFEQFHERVREEIAKAQAEAADALKQALR